MSKARIQKVLAEAGVASRRAIERMVLEGRISINGSYVSELPCFVDPASDVVRVDGRGVSFRRPQRKVYYLLNKPRGVVCTQDNQGDDRPRAVDLVPPVKERIYCIGRLDAESTGAIILTNDGELTEYLTHPRYGVVKTYVVEVDGRLSGGEIEKLKAGVYVDGKQTRAAGIKVLHRGAKRSLLEFRIREGRNREIRRMLAQLGVKVRGLKRTAIGPLTATGLKVGRFRRLVAAEVARLRRCGQARPAQRKQQTPKTD